MACRLAAWFLATAVICAQLTPALAESSSPQESLEQALPLFRSQKYAQAIPLLRAAIQDPGQRKDVVLLLGICLFRTGALTESEQHLREAAEAEDRDTKEAAQLFLGLLFDEQGATDQALSQLGKATASQEFGSAAQTLREQRRPHRLLLSMMVAPEFDGNVRLTDVANWSSAPQSASDGDILFLASLGVRPFSFGLGFGNVISYRQQITLRDYSLLLNSTWLGYSYAGTRNRFRAHTSFNVAMLGSTLLFLDFTGRISHRVKLWSQLGLGGSYEFRHRKYSPEDYQSLSGQTHTGQLDLSYATVPDPVMITLGYQLVRDDLEIPKTPLLMSDDYRAVSHGPLFRMRARLHKRVDWSILSQYLRRQFDYVPGSDLPSANGVARADHYVNVDTSLSVRFGGYFETFFGGSFAYNQSNRTGFSYLKPTAYVGLAAYFGLL